mmetsp:Transcript_46095/g.75466  ORF Transcript_46095/g.75466 Transcript_46095/m.75466 type:complete len:234 (-) Transcript_46095:30-731(-)
MQRWAVVQQSNLLAVGLAAVITQLLSSRQHRASQHQNTGTRIQLPNALLLDCADGGIHHIVKDRPLPSPRPCDQYSIGAQDPGICLEHVFDAEEGACQEEPHSPSPKASTDHHRRRLALLATCGHEGISAQRIRSNSEPSTDGTCRHVGTNAWPPKPMPQALLRPYLQREGPERSIAGLRVGHLPADPEAVQGVEGSHERTQGDPRSKHTTPKLTALLLQFALLHDLSNLVHE